MFLPIPGLGIFNLGKVGHMVFPAAQRIAVVANALAILPLISLVGGIAGFLWIKNSPDAWQLFVGGVAMMYVSFIGRWIWLRPVRIVRIGMSSIEVRFSSTEYAEEFCRLNDLHCATKPTPKRATPVTVNDIG
jgi:hypothetical protein